MEIRENVQNYITTNGTPIRFRIGIDSGSVVAGVIGKKKFIYDLWGDAVNTASRMADFGVIGEVQVTERFIKALENYFQNHPVSENKNTYNYIERGEIEIKGKGIMKTFILRNKDD